MVEANVKLLSGEAKIVYHVIYLLIMHRFLFLFCVGKVANKLYLLSYISENIQQYATDMLLSAVNQHISDPELSQSGSSDQRLEGEVLNILFVLFFWQFLRFLPFFHIKLWDYNGGYTWMFPSW